MNSALGTRLRNLFCRATTVLVNSGANLQRLQLRLFGNEGADGIEFMEHYGLTSNPPAGLDAAVLFVGGSRDNGVCVAVGDRKFRIRGLKTGEVAIYTDEGDKLVFERGNSVRLTTKHLIVDAEQDVVINTKNYQVNAAAGVEFNAPVWSLGTAGGGRAAAVMDADIMQDGAHTSSGDQVAAGVSLINHPHRDAGGDGDSGPPRVGA